MVGLMANSKRIYTKRDLLVPLSIWQAPANPCLLTRPSNTSRRFRFSLLWSLLFSGSWCTKNFACALQAWSVCFPYSYGSLVIKSHCASRSDSLGIPSPFVGSSGWEAWHGFQTFATVRYFFLYYCSPVCGSPTWWGWDLILSWLCPSYSLAAASSLSLDVGYHFSGRFQHPPVNGCSTASCDFGALTGGDECTSFCSTILNWKLVLQNFYENFLLLKFGRLLCGLVWSVDPWDPSKRSVK